MDPAADTNDPEPFGQRGIRRNARPMFVSLCAFGVAVCIAMVVRSQGYYDVVWKSENNVRTEVVSAIGRVMITTRTSYRNPQGVAWTYESAEIGSLDDNWKPSIWKTVGVDWGSEHFISFRGQPITQRWLRIQWRTLLLVYLAPVLIDGLAKWRRRRRGERPRGFDAAAAQ